MFYIVKSKKTDKCKVVNYLEDSNPELKVSYRKSNVVGREFYQIQYKTGYWLMGYCDYKSNHYIGEPDTFRTLTFESNDGCELFMRLFSKNLESYRQDRNKATEVNL